MPEQIELICQNCGNTLEIPEGLEEFSCLYCGARQRTATALALQKKAGSQYEMLRAELQDRLPKTVTEYPDLCQKITKKEFSDTFACYERENADVLIDFDVCVRMRPGMMEQSVREICADFLDAVEAYLRNDPRWNKKGRHTGLMFEVKTVLAIFLTPLARKLRLDSAELFRTELHRQWMERFPKENWTPGDYETIQSGFRKSKLCFISTATCAHEGKPDDCAELTAFRAFRDGWLTDHGGQALIERYYEIAPWIVTCIDYCDDADARYTELRERWLTPCYRALREGRYADCRDLYTVMVRTMERRYLQ